MKLGKVIYKEEIQNKIDILEYIHLDNYKMDENTPTLFVGIDVVEKFFNIDDISILNIHIKNNFYWCESEEEKFTAFNSKIETFVSEILKNIKSIEYQEINPLIYKITKLSIIMHWIDKLKNPTTFYHNGILYILNENTVYSLDSRFFSFLDIDFNQILNRFNHDGVTNEYISFINEYLNGDMRYVPYFIKNNELSVKV